MQGRVVSEQTVLPQVLSVVGHDHDHRRLAPSLHQLDEAADQAVEIASGGFVQRTNRGHVAGAGRGSQAHLAQLVVDETGASAGSRPGRTQRRVISKWRVIRRVGFHEVDEPELRTRGRTCLQEPSRRGDGPAAAVVTPRHVETPPDVGTASPPVAESPRSDRGEAVEAPVEPSPRADPRVAAHAPGPVVASSKLVGEPGATMSGHRRGGRPGLAVPHAQALPRDPVDRRQKPAEERGGRGERPRGGSPRAEIDDAF